MAWPLLGSIVLLVLAATFLKWLLCHEAEEGSTPAAVGIRWMALTLLVAICLRYGLPGFVAWIGSLS